MATNYYKLDETLVLNYLQKSKSIVGFSLADIVCEEVGDGNLNMIFRVFARDDPLRSIIVKQALPYIRLVGESWPLTSDRARIEAQALDLQSKFCPSLVPKLYSFDPAMCLTVMEDLRNAIILRKGLITQQQYPSFSEHISEFLARTLLMTSDFCMNPAAKKAAVIKFSNPELCQLSEDVIFTAPLDASAPTNKNNPLIDKDLILQLRRDVQLRNEVRMLKYMFMTRAESLLHGDLHTGSIMVTETHTYVIDPEFAFYGPMGFDLGALIGNLIIAVYSQLGHLANNDGKRKQYQEWILHTIAEVWLKFSEKFEVLWMAHDPFVDPSFRQTFLRNLLSDSIGFAGCKMIRRVLGIAHVLDLESISDASLRARAETRVLQAAREMILRRTSIQTVQELVTMIRNTL